MAKVLKIGEAVVLVVGKGVNVSAARQPLGETFSPRHEPEECREALVEAVLERKLDRAGEVVHRSEQGPMLQVARPVDIHDAARLAGNCQARVD